MAIKYGLYKTPVPGDREEKQAYHARFISTSRTTLERLSQLVSSQTNLSESEVAGVLLAFVSVFKLEMKAGITVELEGIGTFFPALTSHMEINEMGEEELTVKVKTVGFRCAKSLRKEIRDIPLQRDPDKHLYMHRMPVEERKAQILSLLEEDISFTTHDVRKLNHCSKIQALADIKELLEEKKIISTGKGKNVLYLRPYK